MKRYEIIGCGWAEVHNEEGKYVLFSDAQLLADRVRELEEAVKVLAETLVRFRLPCRFCSTEGKHSKNCYMNAIMNNTIAAIAVKEASTR